MKSTTIIIAAALTLSVNVLFAGNDNTSATEASPATSITLASFAPNFPVEADFNDAEMIYDAAYLAPGNPTEASFDEMSYEMVSALNLAPVVQSTADVDDEIDYAYLAPAVPAQADFE